MGSLGFDILTKSTSPVEIRRIFQQLYTKTLNELGSMAKQDADDVAITGGSIEGTDIDITGTTFTHGDKQIGVNGLSTTETSTALVLKPDGAGGVVWGWASSIGSARVALDGEVKTLPDTYCLVLIDYIDGDDTGEWVLEGDAVIEILSSETWKNVGDKRIAGNGDLRVLRDGSSLVVIKYIGTTGTGKWALEGDAAVEIL